MGDFFASLKDPQSCRRRPCNGGELRRFAPWSPRSRGVPCNGEFFRCAQRSPRSWEVPCNSKFYKRNYIRSMIFFYLSNLSLSSKLDAPSYTNKKTATKGCCFVYKIWLRKEGDSNPRYGDPYVSLANWWFQPLTHPSECECKYSTRNWYKKIFFTKKSNKSPKLYTCTKY